jgi:hypothetical protein
MNYLLAESLPPRGQYPFYAPIIRYRRNYANHINVNLVTVRIADNPSIDSQLTIIGIHNDLQDERGEVIFGKYRFQVAVTQIPEQPVSGFPYTDTAFFLLGKKGLRLTP